MTNPSQVAKFFTERILDPSSPERSEYWVEKTYQDLLLVWHKHLLASLPGESKREKILAYLEGILKGEVVFPQEAASNIPSQETLEELERQKEQAESLLQRESIKKVEDSLFELWLKQQKEARLKRVVEEARPEVEAALEKAGAGNPQETASLLLEELAEKIKQAAPKESLQETISSALRREGSAPSQEAVKKVLEKLQETELGQRFLPEDFAAYKPIATGFVRPPSEPIETETKEVDTSQKREPGIDRQALLLRATSRPLTPTNRFWFALTGRGEPAQRNVALVLRELQKLKEEYPNSQKVRLLEEQIRGWVGQLTPSGELLEEVEFATGQSPEAVLRQLQSRGGTIFRIERDPSSGKVAFFRESVTQAFSPKTPSAGPLRTSFLFRIRSFFQHLASKIGGWLKNLFTTPKLSFLRISLGGALGFGAISLPLGLSGRIALGGTAGIVAAPDILRFRQRLLPSLGGAARMAAFSLPRLPALVGISAGAIIAILIFVPSSLAFLGLLNEMVESGAYVQTGGAPVPADELPPNFKPPEAEQPIEAVADWAWPTDFRICTSSYGRRPKASGAAGTEFHGGIDIKAPLGAEIYPVASGTVVLAQRRLGGPYGYHVVVQHAENFYSLYGHLRPVAAEIEVGARVEGGSTILGSSGDSGYSFGAHLHLATANEFSASCGWSACFDTAPNPCDFFEKYGNITCPVGCR